MKSFPIVFFPKSIKKYLRCKFLGDILGDISAIFTEDF